MDLTQIWNQYKQANNIQDDLYKGAYSFGVEADHLANLVVTNQKTATSSLAIMYDFEQEQLPKVNQYYIILDSKDKPVAIIRNVEIRQFKFKDVTPEIAELEGEGTLDKWIQDHKNFFTNELKHKNIQFNDNHQVDTEVFELVKIVTATNNREI